VLDSILQSPSLTKYYIACTSGEPAICSVFLFVVQYPYSNPGLLIVEVRRLHSFRHTPLDEGSARRSTVSLEVYNV
jgi:hypothetical protein